MAVMTCAVTAAQSILIETPPHAQEPAPQAPPVPPERERPASDELAGLRRKLRRLARRVDVLEGRDQGALDD